MVFIDPSVMELRYSQEYSQIDRLRFYAQIGNLPEKHFISIDYPCDMNLEMAELFIKKSIENNWKYAENPQYICTVQYDFLDFEDFKRRMEELRPIYAGKKKIVGLGNLCRLFVSATDRKSDAEQYRYMKKIIHYIIQHKDDFYWIHIYGLALFGIKEFLPLLAYHNIQISVDNTKWTRPATTRLKNKYMIPQTQTQLIPTRCPGLGCSTDTRDEFFLVYMKEIGKHVKVIY